MTSVVICPFNLVTAVFFKKGSYSEHHWYFLNFILLYVICIKTCVEVVIAQLSIWLGKATAQTLTPGSHLQPLIVVYIIL